MTRRRLTYISGKFDKKVKIVIDTARSVDFPSLQIVIYYVKYVFFIVNCFCDNFTVVKGFELKELQS